MLKTTRRARVAAVATITAGMAWWAVPGAAADESLQVSSGAAFVGALADCEELASGEVCTITIAADLEIAHGAYPAYDGAADLVIQGAGPDVTVRPASGIQLLPH